eukprot:UN31282
MNLTALHTVIDAIVKDRKHIPFRDSKLTMVLKNSFSGNTRTCMCLQVSPHIFNREETLNTLNLGKRAKHIKNKVSENREQSVEELLKPIAELEEENEILKHDLASMKLATSTLDLSNQKSSQRRDSSLRVTKNPLKNTAKKADEPNKLNQKKLIKLQLKLDKTEQHLKRLRKDRNKAL